MADVQSASDFDFDFRDFRSDPEIVDRRRILLWLHSWSQNRAGSPGLDAAFIEIFGYKGSCPASEMRSRLPEGRVVL